jgi:hypothetical protein
MANYGTIVGGDAYWVARLGGDAWNNATSSNKTKALTTGTQIIDALNYLGAKTDEDQVNQFPRDEDTAVPDDITYANYEIASALLDGIDTELEYDNLSLIVQKHATAQATYKRDEHPPHILAGVPSMAAWRYLKPYLRDSLEIGLERVS